MAKSPLFSLTCLFLLVLFNAVLMFLSCKHRCCCHGSSYGWNEFNSMRQKWWFGSQRESYEQQRCLQLETIYPLEPNRQIQHEAGVTEIWDQTNHQMQCVGVATTRHIIEPRGLLLPSFNNAPMLAYVLQGRGILETIFPGCPETFQSFEQSPYEDEGDYQYERYSSSIDQHQKIHRFRQGDILALPTGIAHWTYNDGNDNLVLLLVHDTSRNENQLDQNLRRFFLAGNNPQQHQQRIYQPRQQEGGNNIMQGFDTEILAEAFDVNIETARHLQDQNDKRGFIVRLKHDLQLLRPQFKQEEMQREKEGWYKTANGFEETICSMRIKENIDDSETDDVFSAKEGRISTLNSRNLPILKRVHLSAERGILYKNAMIAPHWNTNANTLLYVVRGTGRVQIVGSNNRPAFDGEVHHGQLIVIPQNFVVVKISFDEGLEWISFKTNDQAKISTLSGKSSVLRAIPVDILSTAYQLSRQEAMRLKYNRKKVTILSHRKARAGRDLGP